MYPSLFIVIILLSIVIRYDAQAFTTPPRTTTIIQCISSSYYHHTDVVSSRRKNEFHNFVQLYSANTDEEVATTIIQQNCDGASSSAIENQVVYNTAGMPTLTQLIVDDTTNESTVSEEDAEQSYRRGLATIGFITLLFASNSPSLHSAFAFTTTAPPVLLINALVTVVGKSRELSSCLFVDQIMNKNLRPLFLLPGLSGVVVVSPLLGQIVPDPSKKRLENDIIAYDDVDDETTTATATTTKSLNNFATLAGSSSTIAGAELGLWKTLGTTANIYGLSQTSSDHGAFLIQLTTLIVPAAQGLSGVPIPKRIWTAIGLALAGVFMFTQDPSQSDCASLQGDLICALAAIFYATYDLRLFKWGKIVPTDQLITTKMVTQSLLSFGLLAMLGREETLDFILKASYHDLELVGLVSLWSGLAVNCIAPYLQVSGQQAVGPARAQILYASQPLWASIMGFVILNEQFGIEGFIGGAAFLGAMFLAATADMPNPDCGVVECEV